MRWMLLPVLMCWCIGCERVDDASTSATIAPPSSQPAASQPAEADEPAEIAISEDLWARMERSRDIALQACGPEPFLPFALYDVADDGEDEVRRYRGEAELPLLLAAARSDMSKQAHSMYAIAHHAILATDTEEATAIVIEVCERVTGACNRFGQLYTLGDDGTAALQGDLFYISDCLSAFAPGMPVAEEVPMP